MSVKLVKITTRVQQEVVNVLIACRVPMAHKIDHTSGTPVDCGWFAVRIEKRGNFFYANNKRIRRHVANAVVSAGLAF